MARPNRAHVKIGSYDYLLAEEVANHYVHEKPELIRPEEIIGDVGKKNLHADRLLWTMTDWSGGEGARAYDPSDPTVYSYADDNDTSSATKSGGSNNTRIPGQFTGRPNRLYDNSMTSITFSGDKPYAAIAQGRVWIAGSKEIFKNDDLTTTFTAKTSSVSDIITAVGGSDSVFYYAEGAGTNRKVWQITSAGTATAVIASEASAFPFREKLIVFKGQLYGWTGRKLWQFDIGESLPLTAGANPGYRLAFDTKDNEMSNGNYGGNSADAWWCDLAEADKSFFFMVASRGRTRIYQWQGGVATLFANLPLGFTCKSIVCQNSVLFAFGHWHGDNTGASGAGSAYAIPITTRQWIPLGAFRKHLDVHYQMQEACNSYDTQIMVAAANQGIIFIYDMAYDSITALDNLPWTFAGSDNKVGCMLTYGSKRLVVQYDPRAANNSVDVGKYIAWVYDEDTQDNREISTGTHDIDETLYMPFYDFNIPLDTKRLMGFHISYLVEGATTSGLLAGQKIKISYALDDGSYTALTTITSATTPSTGVKGRHYLPVSTTSSTLKFFRMKYKVETIVTDADGRQQAPVVLSISAEAQSLARDETWDLIVRLKDEIDGRRVLGRKWKAETARDYLLAAADNKNVITFLDYYRYNAAVKEYTTHSVVVGDVSDIINTHGEGVMRVKLKAVST